MSSHTLRALMLGVSLTALAATAPTIALAGEEEATTVDALVISAAARQTPATQETATAEEIQATVNAVNVEDTVKYLPSLIVRKRHIGDTQAPLATRTSGLGASARTLIFADGILLSALIGNNNSTASPRWSMVTPDEIARIDFLYGPFAAPYAGNSIGGVLNITTEVPTKREGQIHLAGSRQAFRQFATDNDYSAGQVSASFGDRRGAFWYRLSGNVVESNSQPLSYVTATRPANPSGSGTPVIGPFADVNRTGAPIAVFGAGGLEHQVQTNLKLKAGYDFDAVRLVYTIGQFRNDTASHPETYARNGAGDPVYSGTVNFEGYAYSLAASAFSNSLYAIDETHIAQSLAATSRGEGPWRWSVTVSDYDYATEEQRTASTAIPSALTGGAGTILDMGGTGWSTFDGTLSREVGAQTLSAGLHADQVELASTRHATTDWRRGAAGAVTQQSLGKTRTDALWVQDSADLSDTVKLVVGGRFERWKAFGGFNYSLSPALSVNQPARRDTTFSPKASLTWARMDGWTLSASYGEAYRFPTVTELYQAITTGVTLTVPNPDLRPEHARSAELAVERRFEGGRIRASLFDELIEDALISQSAPLVPSSTTLYSYVQNIDRTHVQGLELAAQVKDLLIEGLELSGSVTWTDPVVEKDTAFPAAVGKQTPGIPKVKATFVATWRPVETWSFTAAARYSSRLYATIDNIDVNTHTYQGFDPFLVADVRVTHTLNEHWQAAVGVDNLFDNRYFLFHPFPGRTAMAELNYKF